MRKTSGVPRKGRWGPSLVQWALLSVPLLTGSSHPGAAGLAPRQASSASARPDQVQLSWIGDPSTSMAVTWRTAADGPGPYVVEWRSASDGASAGRADATSEPAPGGRGVLHKAELTGLKPDTPYVYRVAGDGGSWGEERSFRTAPASLPPEGVSFTMHADVGTSYMFADVEPIMRQLAQESAGPHLVVGDLTCADLYRGTEEEEHWLTTDLALVAGHRPVLVTWGNHE